VCSACNEPRCGDHSQLLDGYRVCGGCWSSEYAKTPAGVAVREKQEREEARRDRVVAANASMSDLAVPELIEAIKQDGQLLDLVKLARRWPQIVNELAPEDYDVVSIRARHRLGTTTWKEVERIPVWVARDAMETTAGDAEGGYYKTRATGLLSRHGKTWFCQLLRTIPLAST